MIIYSNFSSERPKTKKEKIINSVLYILFGLLFIFLSNFVVESFALIIGITIILFGVNRLIFALTYHQTFDLIMAILLLVLGVVTTFSTDGTITFIRYLISFGAILMGVNRIFYSFMLKEVVRYWYVNLILGILISTLGILMISGIFKLNIIVIILGVIFLIYGVSKLVTTLLTDEEEVNNSTTQFFEKFSHKHNDDVIDVEFKEKNDHEDR